MHRQRYERSCATCSHGGRGLLVRQLRWETGPPDYPHFGGCSRPFGDDRRGGWLEETILLRFLATRPAQNYPDGVYVSVNRLKNMASSHSPSPRLPDVVKTIVYEEIVVPHLVGRAEVFVSLTPG
jgi:hypothetical protein